MNETMMERTRQDNGSRAYRGVHGGGLNLAVNTIPWEASEIGGFVILDNESGTERPLTR